MRKEKNSATPVFDKVNEGREGYELTGNNDYRARGFALHSSEMPNNEARFAMALLERWGLVVAEQDGEDSAGRARIKRLPAEETVNLALDTAQAFYAAARERSLMIPLPDVETMRDLEREMEGRN